MSSLFLCGSPLSPQSYPVCNDGISPIAFQKPDELFPVVMTPPNLDHQQNISPVVRAPNLWLASPLTPLTDTPPRIKRKYDSLPHRTLRSSRLSTPSPSLASSSTTTQSTDTVPIYTTRSFPPHIPHSPSFPLLYRRYPLSSYYALTPDSDPTTLFNPSLPGGTYNPPRSPLDLYTPRFTRGKGISKQGLCPICTESRARGGASKRLWLSMKFSAFNYHLQYYHGISASTGRPFSPPLAFRTTLRPNAAKHERAAIQEAHCHKCKRWIPVEGVKDVEAKVKELYWWKHAAICHGASSLDELNDVFEQDAVYAVVSQL
ncbi:hypothetical protein C0991_004437 [Blastosporella zonata]|nr:hypothetical protein C0991_004437 [Blastosporella zonata]